MGGKRDRKYGKRRWGPGPDLVCQGEECGENFKQESDSIRLMVLGTLAAELKKTWAGGSSVRPPQAREDRGLAQGGGLDPVGGSKVGITAPHL